MTTTPNQTVRYEVADGVATVTLDRPDSLNSMTNEFMDDITAAFGFVEADPSVRVVVVTGEGRGFCSGADLREADLIEANLIYRAMQQLRRSLKHSFETRRRAQDNKISRNEGAGHV